MPNTPNPLLKNTLLTLLVFLKHRAEDKGLKPIITVAKLTDLLRGSGLKVSYQQLVNLSKDPAISSSIKSINKNQVELRLDDDEPSSSTMPEISNVEPEGQSEENMDGDDEYNPEDFAMPEGEDEEPQEEQSEEGADYAVEPQEGPRQQQSIVSQMAKRAAARPD